MKLFLKTFVVVAVMLGAMTGCTTLAMLTGYGGTVAVKGQFRVQLVECVGSASGQSVTAVLAVTNTGPNTSAYIGGSGNGTVAVDTYGSTAKPYGSAGTYYELPSGVTVRVEIPNINPVRPGTAAFQSLRINVGAGRDNIADFRAVPITWQ